MRVEFFRHNLGQEELDEIRRTFDSKFLTYGPQTRAFEEDFGRWLGVSRVVGLNSCTSGLFLALKALGIGEGDEVITTPLSFAATSNAVLHAGGVPVFADVDPEDGLLNIEKARAAITPRTRALLVVHLYGRMVDVVRYRELADRHGLHLIEDAAHCIEGKSGEVSPGQRSHAAVFSFYATKNISCGEGGALATMSEEVADGVRKLSQHGLSRSAVNRYHGKFEPWDVEMLGYKANMNDIQAAILRAQLRKLPTFREKRLVAYRRYEELLGSRCGELVRLPRTRAGVVSANHLFVVWCPDGTRDALMSFLMENDVGVGIHYAPIHLTSYYRRQLGFGEGRFPVAEELGRNCLSLPFFPDISPAEQEYVVDKISEFYRRQTAR